MTLRANAKFLLEQTQGLSPAIDPYPERKTAFTQLADRLKEFGKNLEQPSKSPAELRERVAQLQQFVFELHVESTQIYGEMKLAIHSAREHLASTVAKELRKVPTAKANGALPAR